MTDRPFLIFLHIQKTAGITLQRVLRRRLGRSLPARFWRMLRSSAQGTLEEQMSRHTYQDGYFAGHICYGVHELLPRPSTYVTFLREPVSRLVSLYQYSRDNPTAYYHRHAVNRTAEQFLLESGLHELDNGQVRFLAGGDPRHFINRTPFGQCTHELLELAIRHAESDFGLIGLTERFDESFLMLTELLGLGSTYYLSRNRARGQKESLSAELLAEVRRRNTLDVQLYDYAVQRHIRNWEAAGLAARLPGFQQANARFQTWFGIPYDIYSRCKGWARGRSEAPA